MYVYCRITFLVALCVCSISVADRLVIEPLIPLSDDGPSSVDIVLSNPTNVPQKVKIELSGGTGQDSVIGFSSVSGLFVCSTEETVVVTDGKGKKSTKKGRGLAGAFSGFGSNKNDKNKNQPNSTVTTSRSCKLVNDTYTIDGGSSLSVSGLNFQLMGSTTSSELTDYAGGYISIQVADAGTGYLVGRLIFNDQDKVTTSSTSSNYNKRGKFRGTSSSTGTMNMVRSIVVPINNGRPF
jgi:hypothetical protein